jgi:putative restriction endonuclease
MPLTADQWLERLAHLRVDGGTTDPAPHKPLLLLVVLDLAGSGDLPEALELTPQLAFRFVNFWSIVAHRRTQRPDIRLPFYHLHSDGVWTPLGEDHSPIPDRGARLLARFARFDPSFLALTRDPAWRERAARVLIATWFQPAERRELYDLLNLPTPTDEDILQDIRYQAAERPPVNAREVRFRLDVVAAHNHTCALTRYRLITVDAASIVDAAHIHAFASSGTNDVRNGLALSKNAHWLFDNGLWTLTDQYELLVATGHFHEDNLGQSMPLLSRFAGRRILLPDKPTLWPLQEHLARHRKNTFLGTAD